MIRRAVFAAITLLFAVAGFETRAEGPAPANDLIMELKNGQVTIRLWPDRAPEHVERIRTLVRQGFYDGIVFHRVIKGFMAQTGDPTGTGTGGSSLPDIDAEFTNTEFKRGVLGMARSRDPNSANSQFFITYADASHLNGQYTAFGAVTKGMELVDGIRNGSAAKNGMVDRPDKIVRMYLANEAPVVVSRNDPNPPAESKPVSIPANERRVALVIGNSEYASTTKLVNPKNDAELMANALRSVGFEVTLVIDADQRAMKQAMLSFGRELRKDATTSLFYYAGHGIQVRGRNYLIPVDAQIHAEDEIDLEGIDVNRFLSVMNDSKSLVNIVVLDACRNNPFTRAFRSAGGGGLAAPAQTPRGTFIAYATAPGTVALDGDGTKNSPYTEALSRAITIPGISLETVFKRTRARVLEVTDESQVPWETSSITGEFYFKPVK